MECIICKTQVATVNEVFFFIQKEKQVHLSIKPEIKQPETFHEVEECTKKVQLKCNQCNANIGCVLPYGPDGTIFCAFSARSVMLCDRELLKKQTWHHVYKDWKNVQNRDQRTFFNTYWDSSKGDVMLKSTLETSTITFPSLLKDFEWYSVSLKKIPRDYQIQGFIEALQCNLIAILPTGTGKTLIASMFLGKMCQLNPNKMGLMIVDRIALVFQQGIAMQEDTKLRVVKTYGESRTKLMLEQINEHRYDILVVTAGAFLAMKGDIDLNLFCAVVFDECHHVSGSHAYTEVLNLFKQTSFKEQPRILGLTASPFNKSMSVSQADNHLKEYLRQYHPDAKIFCPVIPSNQISEEVKTVKLSPIENQFITDVVTILNEHLNSISAIGNLTVREDLMNMSQIIGSLRAISEEHSFDPNIRNSLSHAFKMINSLEICTTLGVPAACCVFEDIKNYKDIFQRYKKTDAVSDRLHHLGKLLENIRANSKVLVFVSTRKIARTLSTYLAKKFQSLKVKMVVGRGGHDGMNWEDEQQETLKQFSGGDCNLLVCTSVLEEGLDVASCDLVICFTGVRSVIQLIQARGRARKQNQSRFIIYQTEAENKKNKDISQAEQNLHIALRKIPQGLLAESTGNIKMKIEDELGYNYKLTPDENEKDFSFSLYIDKTHGIEISALKVNLQKLLANYDDFYLTRLEYVSRDTDVDSMTNQAFSRETLLFVVGARCPSNISSPREAYIMFCRKFTFQLELEDTTAKIWTKRRFKQRSIAENAMLTSTGYALGNFIDKTSVNIVKRFDQEVTVNFNMLECSMKKHIEIIDTGESDNLVQYIHIIKIPLSSLSNFALLSFSQHTFTVTVVLRYPPFVYQRQGIETQQTKRQWSNNKIVQYFSKHPALFITFKMEDLIKVQKIWESPSLFAISLFDVNLMFKPLAEITPSISISSVCNIEKRIFWNIKCLEDSRRICMPKHFKRCHITLHESIEEHFSLVERVVNNVCNSPVNYFLDFHSLYDAAYETFLNLVPMEDRSLLDDIIPQNHFLIKRVIATPSRVICLPAVPVPSNRLLRRLTLSKHDVITVSFRDEDMSKIQNEAEILEYVESIIRKGFLINNERYHFLFPSSSQLRNHKGYFIAAKDYEELQNIRRLIIPKPHAFTSCAKYLSRLGLYGTADKCVIKVFASDIVWKKDIKAQDGELTTDGAGYISINLAQKVAEILKKDIPSAFQIRYSGMKGMLLVVSSKHPDLEGKSIMFRESMKKFENDDNDLCIVNFSKLNHLTLNRDIITLLSAIKSDWFINSTLLRYQEDSLKIYADIFTSMHSAQNVLNEFFPKLIVDSMKSCSFDILDEQYWFQILQGVFRLKVKDIKCKTHIPVEQGQLLVGVPDPYGVLSENEIFVQLKEDGKDNQIISGPAIIYRNPCLHPGDVRQVTCVHKHQLTDLYNTVVLPVVGCKTSLANECSGGDLDGDKFAVIWDPMLIPPEGTTFLPCDYAALTASSSAESKADVTKQNELANIFRTYMANDSLGRIAHKHLALCDILDDGAQDPLAIQLAKLQSKAVDCAKTGFFPAVPAEATDRIDEEGFPDFMEKDIGKSYASPKILGQLYRHCKSITYDFDILQEQHSDCALLSQKFVVEGYGSYIPEARHIYATYKNHMVMLMTKFELKCEADVILGQATNQWSLHLEPDKGKASDAITACYQIIVKTYREIFFSNVPDQESRWKKASAWYQIVNNPEYKLKKDATNQLFLSFPWIVTDILCEMNATQTCDQLGMRKKAIGKSALDMYKDSSSMLRNIVLGKLLFMKEIETAIHRFCEDTYKLKDGVTIAAYGSTSIYVCEPESDVDVCMYLQPEFYKSTILPEYQRGKYEQFPNIEQQRYILQSVVSRAVDTIVLTKWEELKRDIPIVECENDCFENPIHCDISMNKIGLYKTLYIHFLYEVDSCYLPLFWILVTWARDVGLVKSAYVKKECVMDTADFYALIIHLLECPEKDEMKLVQLSHETVIEFFDNISRDLEKLITLDVFHLGSWIFDFYQKACHLSGELILNWPHPLITSVCLKENQIAAIAAAARTAFNCLQYTRNVKEVLTYSSHLCRDSKELEKQLPPAFSCAIGKAAMFHANRLSEISGSCVTITPIEGKENLYLKASGSSLAINILNKELCSMMRSNKALVLGRLFQRASRYFMAGSSIIIAQYNSKIQSCMAFYPSTGPYECTHGTQERMAVYMKNNERDDQWKVKEYERFHSHIFKQIENFPSQNEVLKDSLQVTARFGSFYLVDLSSRLLETQTSLSIQELQLALEKDRCTRKNWKRREYKSNFQQESSTKVMEDPNPGPSSYAMKTLPGASGNKFSVQIKEAVKKRRSNKKGIASTFTPGLFKHNSWSSSDREEILKIYQQILMKCGFSRGSNESRQPCYCKVSISPSVSYEANILLDKEMNLSSIEERSLLWLNGVVVTCNKKDFNGNMMKNPDIRLQIATSDKVKEGSDLYKKCLLNKNDEIIIPVELRKDTRSGSERIILSPKAEQEMKEYVSTVRHVQHLDMFTNGSVDASIVYGTCYHGKNLKETRRFCDLSLYFNPEKLRKAISNYVDNNILKEFTREVFNTSVQIQEAMELTMSSDI